MIELRHLRYFVAVAEELHFTRAADRLGMAQPPLSQQIRALERALGVQLFRRTKRRVELTEAGATFLEGARRTLDEASRAVDDTRRADRGEVGRLSIGFVGTAAVDVLPRILRGYRQRYPDVELALHQRPTMEQVETLHDRTIEIGLLRPPILDDTLAFDTIVSEPVLAVLPQDHGLAAESRIPLRDLAREPFILFPRALGPGAHDRIVRLCNDAGFTPRIEQEAVEMHTIVGLVSAGLGVSLVPESARRLRDDEVRYVALVESAPVWELAIARRRDTASPLVSAFVGVALGDRRMHSQ